MKQYLHTLMFFISAILLIAVSALQAQPVVKSWDFESGNLSSWAFAGAYQSGTAPTGAVVTPTGFTAHSGTHVIQAIKGSGCWQVNLQLDGATSIQPGDSLAFWVYPTVSDTTHSAGYQIFWQDGGWANWNSVTVPINKIKANQWNQVGILASKIASPLNRIGIQTYPKATHADSTAIDTIYIDDITVYHPAATVLSYNFENYSLSDSVSIAHIGYSSSDIKTVIAADPLVSTNKVLKVTTTNYSAGPVLMFVLPSGKTLADYDSLTFNAYYTAGDLSFKLIAAEAYQTFPTGHHLFDADTNYSYNRTLGASTGWERISLAAQKTSAFHDTVYIAFGTNNSGATWYADNVTLVPKAPAADPALVANWGLAPRAANVGWKPINTASTPAGSASMGSSAKPTGFAALKGGFDSLTATTSKALVVTGTLEFVGGGGNSAYTWLRYALFNESGALSNKNTDTAAWSELSNGNGYIFTPVSGTGAIANTFRAITPNQGTEWALIDSKSWTSTNSNNGGALSTVLQQPYHQVAAAGVYDFAISVQPLSTGGNQVTWYLVQQHAAGTSNYYWWGGTVVDTSMKGTTFNSIGFGVNTDIDATCHQINLANVRAVLGSPIVVPDAPFQPFYVNQWGSTPRSGTANGGWKTLNDTTYLDGDAAMGGTAVPTAWATIKGGFPGGSAIKATTGKALKVTGTLEFVGGGGGSGYTWLRYALFNETGVLSGQNKDTANWSETSNGDGYIFTPVSGTGAISNTFRAITPNQGTEWALINSKSWTSTNSNGGGPLSTVLQQPYHQVATAGKYDFAISVQPLPTGGNQVTWYLIQQHAAGSNNYYWWGGTVIDTSKTAPVSFNSIGFACNNDVLATRVNLTNVYVDMGAAPVVADAPFQPFYVNQWGSTPRSGTANGGWKTLNDTTYLDGDAAMGGTAVPTAWATIKGGFPGGSAIKATTGKALKVTGTLEFVGGGGGSGYTWLRYALFNETGVLSGQNKDTANWSETSNGNGYIFTPVSGTGAISNTFRAITPNQGTNWALIDSKSWTSTNSNGGGALALVMQQPYHQVATAGKYDFAISVQPLTAGGNQVTWYFIQQHAAGSTNYYWWGGSFIDTSKTAPVSFNSIGFACNTDVLAKQVNLTNVYVDMGAAPLVPKAPFQPFYVSQWGIFGQRFGGWQVTPGDLSGDVTVSGKSAILFGSSVAVRGAFDSPISPISKDTALVVTGQVEFVGGGFEAAHSLRFGLFYSDSAGVIDTSKGIDSTMWKGNEKYNNGYLLIAENGTNSPITWTAPNKPGTVGGIVNSTWLNTDGAADYVLDSDIPRPTRAAGTAGVYNFGISVAPQSNGSQIIHFKLYKADSSYVWQGETIDASKTLATAKFNSINFALEGGNKTTAIKITNVYADLAKPVAVVTGINEDEQGKLPTSYSLSQNYPNPFNPSTMINFALPRGGNVSLKVYDILGREVATLIDGNMNAGYHQINFNASKFASGVYFYRLTTGDFVSVKKLMLLK